MITNKYKYPELKRIQNKLGRFYIDSDGNEIPSVTTVLDNLSDKKSSLDQWRNRVGDIEADRVMKEATDIGTMVHLALENHLNNIDKDIFTDDSLGNLAKKMSDKLKKEALVDISEVFGLEVHLFLTNLYAGTADCVGIFDGEETLIDFKTSKKIKRKEWISDYFLQCCAYANAHNVMFNTEIRQIVILMVDRDLMFKEFIVKSDEFSFLTEKWKKRLITFKNKYSDIIG